MLLLADLSDADEALAAGFLVALTEPDALDARAAEIVESSLANAPLTLAGDSRADARFSEPDEMVIARVYGSRDFKEGDRGLSCEAGAGLDRRVGPKRNHTIEQMSCLRFQVEFGGLGQGRRNLVERSAMEPLGRWRPPPRPGPSAPELHDLANRFACYLSTCDLRHSARRKKVP